jgi:hypothetical protein
MRIYSTFTYVVSNIMGTKISHGAFNRIENKIECSNWSNGLYVITIFNQSNRTVTNHKIIIEH